MQAMGARLGLGLGWGHLGNTRNKSHTTQTATLNH